MSPSLRHVKPEKILAREVSCVAVPITETFSRYTRTRTEPNS